MKCIECGCEFYEGVFCPECGKKYDENEVKLLEKENEEKRLMKEAERNLQLQKEKEEQEKIQKEKEEKEKALQEEKKKIYEQKKLEKEIALKEAETKRLEAEIKKKEIESKTVRGKVYSTQEEASFAKKEHAKVDELITRVEAANTQKKRREILEKFAEELTLEECKDRLSNLREKVYKKRPLLRTLCEIFGIVSIVCNIFWMIPGFISAFLENEIAEMILAMLAVLLLVGAVIGFIGWLILFIIWLILRKKPEYYLNLKNI